MTVLVAPAFFAAAAGIPTYFIGRRLGGRLGGITAVTVLAFSVGSFSTEAGSDSPTTTSPRRCSRHSPS